MSILDNYCIRFVDRQKAALLPSAFDSSAFSEHEIIGKTLVSLISSGSEIGGYNNFTKGTDNTGKTGYAAVMEVLAVGNFVSSVKPGDRIFSQTPHQLYNRVTEDNAVLVPKGMKPELAVMCRFPAVSMTSMIETTVKPMESVIVTGLGVVGLTCAQMMQHCGYRVYAVDLMQSRRDIAAACGLRHVVGSLSEVPELLGQAGLAIECTGNEQATYSLFDYLRKGAEVFLVGVPWNRTTETYAHDLLRQIFYGFLKVHSGWEWSLPKDSADFLPYSTNGNLKTAMQWIHEGFIKVDGIYEVAEPADCDSIYQAIANRKLEKTCAMFDWRKF